MLCNTVRRSTVLHIQCLAYYTLFFPSAACAGTSPNQDACTGNCIMWPSFIQAIPKLFREELRQNEHANQKKCADNHPRIVSKMTTLKLTGSGEHIVEEDRPDIALDPGRRLRCA